MKTTDTHQAVNHDKQRQSKHVKWGQEKPVKKPSCKNKLKITNNHNHQTRQGLSKIDY